MEPVAVVVRASLPLEAARDLQQQQQQQQQLIATNVNKKTLPENVPTPSVVDQRAGERELILRNHSLIRALQEARSFLSIQVRRPRTLVVYVTSTLTEIVTVYLVLLAADGEAHFQLISRLFWLISRLQLSFLRNEAVAGQV